MKAALLVLACSVWLSGCSKPAPSSRSQRVVLVQKDSSSFELIPSEGQPPYCHVFTIAARGTIRQHTASDDGLSLDCPAGAAIAGTAFRLSARNGKAKVYVIFSDRVLDSNTLSVQIQEFVEQNQAVTAVDLRAPGRVVVETLEFEPSR